jgi:hypothetical protein
MAKNDKSPGTRMPMSKMMGPMFGGGNPARVAAKTPARHQTSRLGGERFSNRAEELAWLHHGRA